MDVSTMSSMLASPLPPSFLGTYSIIIIIIIINIYFTSIKYDNIVIVYIMITRVFFFVAEDSISIYLSIDR